jgi:Fanconi anemia-associated protein
MAGNGYRKRLVQLRNVEEQAKEPRRNPFLRKKGAGLSEDSLFQTMQQIPRAGNINFSLLLQKSPST